MCGRTKLMKWLLSRVKQREFDSVKQYASEVLAILVQNTPANRKRLVQANGIDILLQVSCSVCLHSRHGRKVEPVKVPCIARQQQHLAMQRCMQNVLCRC